MHTLLARTLLLGIALGILPALFVLAPGKQPHPQETPAGPGRPQALRIDTIERVKLRVTSAQLAEFALARASPLALDLDQFMRKQLRALKHAFGWNTHMDLNQGVIFATKHALLQNWPEWEGQDTVDGSPLNTALRTALRGYSFEAVVRPALMHCLEYAQWWAEAPPGTRPTDATCEAQLTTPIPQTDFVRVLAVLQVVAWQGELPRS